MTNTTTSTALVIGSSGGLGAALLQALRADTRYAQVLGLSRATYPALDYADEATLAGSAQWVAQQCAGPEDAQGLAKPLRLIVVATGFLHAGGMGPERSLSQLDAAYLQKVFLINTIGPALVAKHFAPLLAKDGAVTVAMVSAKVGSIGDNALGGWLGYRASKAALNQVVKTASVELARRNKQTVCVAVHPGTVATALSDPFSKNGLNVRPANVAAAEILTVLHGLQPPDNGSFVSYDGKTLPW